MITPMTDAGRQLDAAIAGYSQDAAGVPALVTTGGVDIGAKTVAAAGYSNVAGVPTLVVAGGAGDGIEVVSAYVDLGATIKEVLNAVVGWCAALTAAKTLSLNVDIYDCATSGGGYTKFGDTLSTGVVSTGAGNKSGSLVLPISTTGIKRYVKLYVTPELSADNTDTAFWTGSIISEDSPAIADSAMLTGPAVDCFGYSSGGAGVAYAAALAEAATLKLTIALEESDSELTGYTAVATLNAGAVAVATGGSGGTNESGILGYPINFSAHKRWMRLKITPVLSGTTPDKCMLIPVFTFGGSATVPTTSVEPV
jgi:hypothetical protein